MGKFSNVGIKANNGCMTTRDIYAVVLGEALEDQICGFCEVEMDFIIDEEDGSEILCCPLCDFVVGL